MRTLIFLTAGLLILAGFFMMAKLFSPNQRRAKTLTLLVFVLLWLITTMFNLLGGIKAGYSFAEELPIFLLLFGVPALVAVLLRWKLL
jgi:MFS superfamily sulfate permease-like transporter